MSSREAPSRRPFQLISPAIPADDLREPNHLTPAPRSARGAHVALVGLSGLPESLGLGCSVNHQVPKKFQKLLRRTAIRDDRRSADH